MSDVDAYLDEHTFYCAYFSARITRESCEKRRRAAAMADKPYEIMQFAVCAGCDWGGEMAKRKKYTAIFRQGAVKDYEDAEKGERAAVAERLGVPLGTLVGWVAASRARDEDTAVERLATTQAELDEKCEEVVRLKLRINDLELQIIDLEAERSELVETRGNGRLLVLVPEGYRIEEVS